jgi:hypothetical protein
LTTAIGSNSIITSNVFERKERKEEIFVDNGSSSIIGSTFKNNNRKRRNNRATEVSGEEWEILRTFQTTTIEQKTGVDADTDQIRLYLNKLTDKTFLDIREKIIVQIDKICSNNPTCEDKKKIAVIIYELSAYNKFYSKIFADLYVQLANSYDWIKAEFDDRYSHILDLYKSIEYVDADVNYDKFCDMNKQNDRRRSVTQFLVNLAGNGFIAKRELMSILTHLLEMVYTMISMDNRKNEVDELTENVALLFDKELIESFDQEYTISGKTLMQIVEGLATSKSKDYLSLSNKAIFKYMDLVEL